MFKGNRNILIFFLIITTSALAFAKVDQDVSCDVTSHYANGQTSYEIKCQKHSDSNEGKIQCCAISNELGISLEWGNRCGAWDESLFNVLHFKSMPDPTSTTCALTVVFRGKQGKKKMEMFLTF